MPSRRLAERLRTLTRMVLIPSPPPAARADAAAIGRGLAHHHDLARFSGVGAPYQLPASSEHEQRRRARAREDPHASDSGAPAANLGDRRGSMTSRTGLLAASVAQGRISASRVSTRAGARPSRIGNSLQTFLTTITWLARYDHALHPRTSRVAARASVSTTLTMASPTVMSCVAPFIWDCSTSAEAAR